MKTPFFLVNGLAACLALMACRDDDPAAPEATTGILVQHHAMFGQVLTDSMGRVLYVFARDAQGTPSCSGNCASLWPAFYSRYAVESEALDSGDFGTVARSDGALQTTYKGWPLYYYADDSGPGTVSGDGVGDNWFVAKPDYLVMLVSNQLVGGDGTAYDADMHSGEGQTRYFVDSYGRTLYGFTRDRYGSNTFTREDFSNNSVWPINEHTIGAVPSVAEASDFAETTVHGRKQLTFRGWPLYYFGQDTVRGNTKGIDFPSLGIWSVLSPGSPEAPQPETE